ncbi:DUF2235 domain-containing protein [Pseudomonas sp. PCH199]|uniref:DUF2235 domain-containing protein n=1 Tax=unclassified Pseudomonas TaxID=196821 RepID=UPI000BC49C30|nr:MULTISPECIES: DUF2235 domain-containing protein [unclassified Pseudomonas]MCW8278836.1 DUF2235 domain-containing protein [Pseudomonas sp. PCH199]PAM80945.1 hypothetical protein CES87_28360 [Pseudomonas sp. ERMR1:02]
MPKNIIVAFDGTWNLPDQKPEIDGDANTNVVKLHDAILASQKDGTVQKKIYIAGVGTDWYDKLEGGAFGVGLSKKIKEGYVELAKNYEEGDQVFIFGFSRGAYSARSLVGLIRNVGLLTKTHIDRIDEAYSLYRTRDSSADTENARFFRQSYSREIDIHFLGVWDTVGALGVPFKSAEWFNQEFYEFHDTELSGIVRNAFHAVAIDENRVNYECTLWDPIAKPNQVMEQVWFCGAHANVGGGYTDNNLSDVPLRWMASKIMDCGLELNPKKIPKQANALADITDSYEDFLGGTYRLLNARYFRPIGKTPFGQECFDDSVQQRVVASSTYRPKNPVDIYLVGTYIPVNKIG